MSIAITRVSRRLGFIVSLEDCQTDVCDMLLVDVDASWQRWVILIKCRGKIEKRKKMELKKSRQKKARHDVRDAAQYRWRQTIRTDRTLIWFGE